MRRINKTLLLMAPGLDAADGDGSNTQSMSTATQNSRIAPVFDCIETEHFSDFVQFFCSIFFLFGLVNVVLLNTR